MGIFMLAFLPAGDAVYAQAQQRLIKLHENTGLGLSATELQGLGLAGNRSGACAYLLIDAENNIRLIYNRVDTVHLNYQQLFALYDLAEKLTWSENTSLESPECMPAVVYPVVESRELLGRSKRQPERNYQIKYDSAAIRVSALVGAGFIVCRGEAGEGLNGGLSFRRNQRVFAINAGMGVKEEELYTDELFWSSTIRRPVLQLQYLDLSLGKGFDSRICAMEIAAGLSVQRVVTRTYKVAETPAFIGSNYTITELSSHESVYPGINGMFRMNFFPGRVLGCTLSMSATLTPMYSTFRMHFLWRIGRLYFINRRGG